MICAFDFACLMCRMVLYNGLLQGREWHWAPQEPCHGAPRAIEYSKELNNLKCPTPDKTEFCRICVFDLFCCQRPRKLSYWAQSEHDCAAGRWLLPGRGRGKPDSKLLTAAPRKFPTSTSTVRLWLCPGGPLPHAGPDYDLEGMPVYTYIHIYTRIKRALRARRGLQTYIMGLYYGIIFQNYITG